MLILKTASLFLTLAFVAPAHAAPELTPAELKDHLWEYADLNALAERLPPRKLITRTFEQKGTEILGGLSIGLIKAPVDKVLPVIMAYQNFKDMLPFFKESTLLGSGGERTLVHVKIELAKGVVKLWGNLEFIESKEKQGILVINGGLMQGNMKVFLARFEIAPTKSGDTLILVRLLVDPDINIAKDAKVNKYNQVNARRFIRAIRDRAVEAK
jgi:hypothetical protein